MNIDQIFELHDAQSSPITCHIAGDKNLELFLESWSKFQKKYFDLPDKRVSDLLKSIAYIRNELMLNPIPYENNSNLLELVKKFQNEVDNIATLFDSQDSAVLISLKDVLELILNQENPLNRIILMFESEMYEKIHFVVLKSGRIRDSVEKYYSDKGLMFRAIMPGEVQLISNENSSLIYVGSPEKYINIERQISSVSATDFHFICFGTKYQIFRGVFGNIAVTNYRRKIKFEFYDGQSQINVFEPYDVSSLTEDILSKALLEDSKQSDLRSAEDLVRCYAYNLANNYVIFLPVPGELSKKVLVEAYVPNASRQDRVQRLEVSEIGADTVFLVRRGSTATEALKPIADEILGTKAHNYREMQMTWKTLLRNRIESLGTDLVIRHLQSLGLKNPYPTFWANPLRIAPRTESFRILLNYLGLSDSADEYMKAVEEIRVAHIKAGHKFLTILQTAFEEVNPAEIYRKGELDRSITGAGEIATLTAIVCLGKLPDIYSVPEEQIRKLIRTEIES